MSIYARIKKNEELTFIEVENNPNEHSIEFDN